MISFFSGILRFFETAAPLWYVELFPLTQEQNMHAWWLSGVISAMCSWTALNKRVCKAILPSVSVSACFFKPACWGPDLMDRLTDQDWSILPLPLSLWGIIIQWHIAIGWPSIQSTTADETVTAPEEHRHTEPVSCFISIACNTFTTALIGSLMTCLF